MAQRLRRITGIVRVLGDPLKIGMYGVAERGEHGERHALPSLEKRAAQLPLQRDNGVGQRGLGDTGPSGRPREILLLAKREEVADLVHLHVPHRSYRL